MKLGILNEPVLKQELAQMMQIVEYLGCEQKPRAM